MLFPLAIATNFLGIWLVRVTPQETFYKIVYVITFMISLELIRNGVTAIFRVCAQQSGYRFCVKARSHQKIIMTVITDPFFYLIAVPAVLALGLAKGGFSGIGIGDAAARARGAAAAGARDRCRS